MAVSTDILASYRRPRAVMRRLLAMPVQEGRALALLMAGCAVVFIGQWPRLARLAHLEGAELNPLLGGALLGWMFIAPLFMYLLAFVLHLVCRALGGRGSAYAARLALFWAFLAASPLILLNGLVAGFVGPGTGLQLVGLLWCVTFAWFVIANLREAGWREQ